MDLSYYVDVPIKNKWLDGSVHNENSGFYLSGCHMDPWLPGQLICEYACNTCYELQDKYKSAKSIEELKVLLMADGIFPHDQSLNN